MLSKLLLHKSLFILSVASFILIPSGAAQSTSMGSAANQQSSSTNNTPETIGQIFTVENSSVVKSCSIELGSSSTTASPATRVAYVREWKETGVQGKVLYQSSSKVKSAGSGVEQFDFATDNTQPVLKPGEQYVAFATTDRNGVVPCTVLLAAAPSDEQQSPPGNAALGASAAVAGIAGVASSINSQGGQQQAEGNNGSQAKGKQELPAGENKPPKNQPQAVPTPALLPGLVGLSVGVLRKRNLEKREASNK